MLIWAAGSCVPWSDHLERPGEAWRVPTHSRGERCGTVEPPYGRPTALWRSDFSVHPESEPSLVQRFLYVALERRYWHVQARHKTQASDHLVGVFWHRERIRLRERICRCCNPALRSRSVQEELAITRGLDGSAVQRRRDRLASFSQSVGGRELSGCAAHACAAKACDPQDASMLATGRRDA